MVIGNEAEAKSNCIECGVPLKTEVLHSNAGYYIGSQCNNCGPHTRESDYFQTQESAEAELKLWEEDNVRPSARTPGYWGGSSGL